MEKCAFMSSGGLKCILSVNDDINETLILPYKVDNKKNRSF